MGFFRDRDFLFRARLKKLKILKKSQNPGDRDFKTYKNLEKIPSAKSRKSRNFISNFYPRDSGFF